MPAPSAGAPEAAMRAALSPRSPKPVRTSALAELCASDAAPPPPAFFVALLRRPHQLTTAHQARLAAKLLRASPAAGRALAAAPARPGGPAAVRACVILAVAAFDADSAAAESVLLAALGQARGMLHPLAEMAARDLPLSALDSMLQRAEAALAGGKAATVRPPLAMAAALCPPGENVSKLFTIATRAALLGSPVGGRALAEAPPNAVVDVSLPLLDRAMRRDRAGALRAIPLLLTSSRSADLSSDSVSTLWSAAVDATQATDAGLRELSCSAISSMASRVHGDAGGAKDAVIKLAGFLKSAKYAYQRTSAAAAMANISSSLGESQGATDSCFPPALEGLTTWLLSRRETGDEARSAAARSVVKVLSLSPVNESESGSWSGSALSAREALAEMLMDKKALAERRAIVCALCDTAENLFACIGQKSGRSTSWEKSPLLDALCSVASLSTTNATAAGSDALRACTVLLRVGVLQDISDSSHTGPANSFVSNLLSPAKSPVLLAAASAAVFRGTRQELPSSVALAVDNVEDAKALIFACEEILTELYRGSETIKLSLAPEAKSNLCTAVVRIACDPRPKLARLALDGVKRIRQRSRAACLDFLRAFYDAELGDSSAARLAAERRAYDFDDLAAERERLVHVLHACVLPKPPVEAAPLALLAAHHPRMFAAMDFRLRVNPGLPNRAWPPIQASLPEVVNLEETVRYSDSESVNGGNGDQSTVPVQEPKSPQPGTLSPSGSSSSQSPKPWLLDALQEAVGAFGLEAHALCVETGNASSGLAPTQSAIWGISDSIKCTASGSVKISILNRVLSLVMPFVSAAPKLSPGHWEALRSCQEFEPDAVRATSQDEQSQTGPVKSRTGSRGKSKPASKSVPPPPGSAAAAAAEKMEKTRKLALETRAAVARTSAALRLLSAICSTSEKTAQYLCPALLSVIMPTSCFPELETECRGVLLALSSTFEPPLRPMALRISSTLYRLGCANYRTKLPSTALQGPDVGGCGDLDVQVDVAYLVHWLKTVSNPPFSAEGFALIAPIVKEAMIRNPSLATASMSRTSAARAAAAGAKKEAIGVTRAGTEVLCAHCKPEAIDAAVAAAGARAGTWALAVLEREDAAFGAAAEALASLAGAALNPGSNLLSQVLSGVVSGKSSVREAALAALERIPALSMSSVACPRDAVLGRTLWLGMHDPEAENAAIAKDLWEQYGHPLNVAEDATAMLALLAHIEPEVRAMAARAIAESLVGDAHSKTRNVVIPQAFTLYLKKLPEAAGGLAPAPEKQRSVPRQRLDPKERAAAEDEIVDDAWHARHGVALALRDLAIHGALSGSDIPVVFAFLASRGLGDLRDEVRDQMSSAAMSVVSCAGEDLGPKVLLPMIDKQLNASSSVEKGTSRHAVAQADRTRENLVMCLGGVAEHLPPEDQRRVNTAKQIIKTAIGTPSEVVQNAAAKCLVPLASEATQGEGGASALRNSLLEKLWSPDASYGERRGAAYALAGVIRGLGVKSMKSFGILEELEAAAAEKTNHRRRQGAFIAMETLAIMLGRLYEPYTVRTLPIVLVSMGDNVTEVRDACWAAAQASMAKVSSQGVKMILPSLLSGLNERQWRTKAGAAEVLGAMAFCAPRQLSECLPQVVPKLAEALADAHPKVVAAAESAIGRIAAVARSPEVRGLSRFLLAALRDPAGRTQGALDAMLGTAFVHAIDPASLALLVPPLHRGLRDRSTELKKRAAAIVGSMCNNVSNHQDVAPYLDLLLPDLRITLLDAIPDVRRTSARAIGALAVALGEEGLPSIIPWLVGALLSGSASSVTVASSLSGQGASPGVVSVSSSAERSGAAMGLAEVCAALSDARIEEILLKVLEAGETSPTAREGGLMLLASLPRSLGERYEDRLALALTSILRGLADDSDSVREAALDAGRKTVSAYAKTSLDALLPELLAAMKDTLWRIRHAATQLLGDFLLVIAGAVSPQGNADVDAAGNDAELMDSDEDGTGNDEGESDGEEDDSDEDDDQLVDSPEMMAAVMTLEATMKAIEDVLGIDRRNEVLAALYIIRCDVSVRVRQMGMQVWKTVVSNTPRVLREIMPCAVKQVIVSLSDEDEERRAAAGKALADLSHKLGDRVVPEVLPALRSSITDATVSPRVRLGACDGLAELVAACPKDQLVVHGEELLAAVCDALCDASPAVRASGAQVFATLLRPLGTDAADKVIPMLISKISGSSVEDDSSSDEASLALDGMKKVMAASGTRLLSIVVPRLLDERPLTRETCRALSAAAAASSSEFEPFVPDVIAVVLEAVDVGSKWAVSLDDHIGPISELLSALADCGNDVASQMLELLYLAFNEVSATRRFAATLLCGAFCRCANVDVVAAKAVSLFEVLIRQLSDSDPDVVSSASKALMDLSSSVPSSLLSVHVGHIRQALRSTGSGVQIGDPEAVVAGLNIPKGPAPFVPIFTEALLNGAPGAREQAALAIADLSEMTNTKVLSPYVIKLTGPLIRVVSERVPWQVKAAILRALLRLLEKAAPLLRTFAPQLQSTFLKGLSDPNRLVRVRACSALGALVPVQPRVEPLLKDLFLLSSNGPSPGARTAAFLASARVFKQCKKLPASAFTTAPTSLTDGLHDDDGDVAKAASRAIGTLAVRAENAQEYVELTMRVISVLESEDSDYDVRSRCLYAVSCIARAGYAVATSLTLQWDHVEDMLRAVVESLRSTTPPVIVAACSAGVDVYALLESKLLAEPSRESRDLILSLMSSHLLEGSPEVRVGSLQSIKRLVTRRPAVVRTLGRALIVCAGSTNTGVRDAADRVLRRAFVVSSEGVVDRKNVDYVKSGLDSEDSAFVDRRLQKLLDMPDSETEQDLATTDD